MALQKETIPGRLGGLYRMKGIEAWSTACKANDLPTAGPPILVYIKGDCLLIGYIKIPASAFNVPVKF